MIRIARVAHADVAVAIENSLRRENVIGRDESSISAVTAGSRGGLGCADASIASANRAASDVRAGKCMPGILSVGGDWWLVAARVFREILFEKFQWPAFKGHRAMLLGMAQFDAADLAGDGLGQFAELQPADPLVRSDFRARNSDARASSGPARSRAALKTLWARTSARVGTRHHGRFGNRRCSISTLSSSNGLSR